MRKLWEKIVSKIDTPLWLEIFFAIIIILRIPSFFEPYYYGDEMIYLTLGQGIRQGIHLYSGLHDNKPPLLYLVAGIAGNLFWFKVILAFWSLATIYIFWKFISSYFPNKKGLHQISTIIFGLLITLPLLEGNIANAEIFMIGPITLAFHILLNKKENIKNAFLGGLLISIAALFKIPAAFDILAIIIFWIIYLKKGSISKNIIRFLSISFGFFLPIFLSFIWYYFNNSFKEYLIAAFLQNFGYVSSWKRSGNQIPFLVKNAPLLIRAFLMFLGFIIIWINKKRISKQFIFICLWLLTSLFAVTLSERPYPHYLIQAIGSISILIAILITNKTKEQTLAIIPLTLAFFVPFYYKFWYYPTVSYYQRFLKFITKIDTKEIYFQKFNYYLTSDYQIASFLQKYSQKNDKIFIWSNDSPSIYALSQRSSISKYVADYHIKDFSSPEETITIVSQQKPKFIITTKNSFSFPELDKFLSLNYFLLLQTDLYKIWSPTYK